jgi:hypothetical protein
VGRPGSAPAIDGSGGGGEPCVDPKGFDGNGGACCGSSARNGALGSVLGRSGIDSGGGTGVGPKPAGEPNPVGDEKAVGDPKLVGGAKPVEDCGGNGATAR